MPHSISHNSIRIYYRMCVNVHYFRDFGKRARANEKRETDTDGRNEKDSRFCTDNFSGGATVIYDL